jgi:hypothetical protein
VVVESLREPRGAVDRGEAQLILSRTLGEEVVIYGDARVEQARGADERRG